MAHKEPLLEWKDLPHRVKIILETIGKSLDSETHFISRFYTDKATQAIVRKNFSTDPRGSALSEAELAIMTDISNRYFVELMLIHCKDSTPGEKKLIRKYNAQKKAREIKKLEEKIAAEKSALAFKKKKSSRPRMPNPFQLSFNLFTNTDNQGNLIPSG